MKKNYTKAEALDKIIQSKKNVVPNYIYFEKKSFLKNQKKFINIIQKKFNKKIIIRSSSKKEDTFKQSFAGKYLSIVSKTDEKSLKLNLQLVGKKLDSSDQIVIQKFIEKPDYSGVIFTKDPNSNSHYYKIEYDQSKRSDLVTSGKFNPTKKKFILFKNFKNKILNLNNLISISKFLEKKFNNDRLDIEFCIKKNKTYILQCRPLLGKKNEIPIKKIEQTLLNLKKKFLKISEKKLSLIGEKTALSNMSDWNPAEIIGNKPSKLASSLYCELITNKIWAEQRSNYGYRDVSPNRLMYIMAGTPYVDLRTDFNSFLPKNLKNKIAIKIINNSLRLINKFPELHDKIEFKIIDTCFNFNCINKKYNFLNQDEKKQYLSELKKLTNNIISKKNNILNSEIKKLELLKKKIIIIKKEPINPIQKIQYLIDDCKKYGTLPFAGIARCAFISKSILDSLVTIKKINQNELNNFLSSINTISKKINNLYISSIKHKKLKTFFKEYGHLRPSTYSISIDNYLNGHKKYFSNDLTFLKINKNYTFKTSIVKKLNIFFKKQNISLNFSDFLKFARQSIVERERAKLIFTKSIDEIFTNIKILAKEININYKKFEDLDINLILNSVNNLEHNKLKNIITENIKINKKERFFSNFIKTPDVILNKNDFYSFFEPAANINFITNNSVMSEIIKISSSEKKFHINNKIVLIENADPGFDFIFSHNIKGLITMYGGANSHMAIRCMELGIPALIGVGSQKFDEISKRKKIFIDCKNKIYKIIY